MNGTDGTEGAVGMGPRAGQALQDLELIERAVAGLNPPVKAFEGLIRQTPFTVLVGVLLSARTRDETTLEACRRLFARADTPEAMASCSVEELAGLIRPVGFFHQKARHLKVLAETLAQEGGVVPQEEEELRRLPGVGPKTARLVRALAFGVPALAVDIHVFRISQRLGWVRGSTPAEVARALERIVPRADWNRVNQTLVGLGQTLCRPRGPLCGRCPLQADCPASSAPAGAGG